MKTSKEKEIKVQDYDLIQNIQILFERNIKPRTM